MDNSINSRLDALAQHVGKDWVAGSYYDEAEQVLEKAWPLEVAPYLNGIDYTVTMDLAAGHGRNSSKLIPLAERFYIVDINQENIDFCKARFGGEDKVTYVRNNGFDLADIPDQSLTFVFCYDAMVHFDDEVVRSYVREFKRIMGPGAKGFVHHSNYTANPCGDVHENPGWRNFMSKDIFARYCYKEGLKVVQQEVIRNGQDCITVFSKPRPPFDPLVFETSATMLPPPHGKRGRLL